MADPDLQAIHAHLASIDRTLAIFATAQQVQTEMLRQLLVVATEEPDGPSPLMEALQAMIAQQSEIMLVLREMPEHVADALAERFDP